MAGVFIITGSNGITSNVGAGGLLVSSVGGIIFVIGVLAGLTRGFNRMMTE